MKKSVISICILALAVCLMFGCGKEEASTPTTAAAPAPDSALLGNFTATDINGNTVDQSVFAGSKLTMINIWGTYCSPCISEMPELGALNREMEDVQVIGIIIDAADINGKPLQSEILTAQAIIRQTGADYLHLIPSAELIQAYLLDVQAVPETIFVDAQGNQVGESYLGARSKSQWQQIIQSLLEEME